MGILDGRVAIVTGASSGVGQACALRFAQEGAAVVGCARRQERLDELVAEITSQGGVAMGVACDVNREADIAAVVAAAAERFGRIDILGNFAQGAYDTEPASLETTTAQSVMDWVRGGPLQYLLFMQQCFPHMKAQRYGRIINTSSDAWRWGLPTFASGGIAKAGVEALSRHASQEWGRYGIVTNTIYPVVASPEQRELYPEGQDSVASQIPVRYHGTPYDDLSPVVAFLASDGGGYVNGQSIAVNGGLFSLTLPS